MLANHAAGVVVGKIGTATVAAPELRAALGGAWRTRGCVRSMTGIRRGRRGRADGARQRRDPRREPALPRRARWRCRASTRAWESEIRDRVRTAAERGRVDVAVDAHAGRGTPPLSGRRARGARAALRRGGASARHGASAWRAT